jgi:hypothetical protein
LNFSNAEDRLFSQLLGDLFMYNGASLGVDVSFSGDDWLIPAGLWSYVGTPVAAIKRLAESPGAVCASAKSGLGFAVDPRYPIPPWAWADAPVFATIPKGYWAGRSRRWASKPPFDLCIVAGDTADGVLVPVQRDGSAGVWESPHVIDRLICSEIPARQRGLRVLADTGRQALETISMPIGSEFGLIPMGALLELQDDVTWRGIVRSVVVSATTASNGATDVMQVLEVERHYV